MVTVDLYLAQGEVARLLRDGHKDIATTGVLWARSHCMAPLSDPFRGVIPLSRVTGGEQASMRAPGGIVPDVDTET